jgi:hypothetical protein
MSRQNPLETIKGKFARDERLSDQEFKALLGLCSQPPQSVRETALDLLLYPPVGDVLSYYGQLLAHLTKSCRKSAELPLPLWELLWELLAARREIPQDPATAIFFKRILAHLPTALMPILYGQSLPVQPFLAHLHLNSFQIPPKRGASGLKRRWRLFRKRLLATPAGPSWAQLTFADLGQLFRGKRTGGSSVIPSGWWLGRGRPLLFPLAGTPAPFVSMALEHYTWGGAGIGARRYLDRLLRAQAEELQCVRTLAHAVSQNTHRVVLSWHNATLAASTGWAFEDLSAQFPSKALWESFGKAVQHRIQNRQCVPQRDLKATGWLWEQWKQRLVTPKVLASLWEDRMLAAIDLSYEVEQRKHLEAARNLLPLPDLDSPSAYQRYGWTGPVSPLQRMDFDDILAWSAGCEGAWHEGLLRLSALLQEGQILLDTGLLQHLVLPWIDKFFISTRREEDWEYLTTLAAWFEGEGLAPLILFWEDTPHRREPSLKLVLQRLHGQGQPFRGIGVFDWQGSLRTEALQTICSEHRQAVLFALRPCSDVHNFRAFEQLLEERSYAFFQEYDSSWKDGLSFLYAGTQVFPLLSVPTDGENVPAWIAGEGLKYPFGAFWRNKLREAVLGKSPRKGDGLSLQYAMWANLC